MPAPAPLPGWAPVELVDPSRGALRRSAAAGLAARAARVGPALGAGMLEAATLALTGVHREPRVARDGRLVVLGGMIWSLAHQGLEQLLGQRCELLGWDAATHVRPVLEADVLLVNLENRPDNLENQPDNLENRPDNESAQPSGEPTTRDRQPCYEVSVWAERALGPVHVLTWQPVVKGK